MALIENKAKHPFFRILPPWLSFFIIIVLRRAVFSQVTSTENEESASITIKCVLSEESIKTAESESRYAINKSGMLKDCLIWIGKPKDNDHTIELKDNSESSLGYSNGAFDKRVIAVCIGDKLVMHNKTNMGFNFIIQGYKKNVINNELFDRTHHVRDNNHKAIVCDESMEFPLPLIITTSRNVAGPPSHVYVHSNKHFCLTSEDGVAHITNLRSGKYDIYIWHELLREITCKIPVKKHAPHTFKFEAELHKGDNELETFRIVGEDK